MSFKENLYEVIPNALSKDTLKVVTTYLDMYRENILREFQAREDILYDPFSYNDIYADNVRNTFGIYAPLITETLLICLQPQVEKITGLSLFPTYSYARYYYHYGKMLEHVDRSSCEYSATVCLANDPDYGPYEIFFRDLNGKPHSLKLNDGDAIVYKGDVLSHWRKTYKGKKHLQAFLHYVDANGKNVEYKYDKRAYVGANPVMKKDKGQENGRNTQYSEVQLTY